MSLPIHVELFEKLGFEMPTYCHTAQLLKLDNGNKRKLSKRKDPELSLDYYKKVGYHPQAVKEYLLTILNSNFEEWRIENPDAPMEEFEFTTAKMSSGGALFDINKLNDVSKDVLLRIPASELAKFMTEWVREYKPKALKYFEGNEEYIAKILDLGRTGNKPRKDLVYAKQIFDFISYFFDDYFVITDQIPEQISDADATEILKRYLESYDQSDDQSQWFDKIRTIAEDMGYAAKPKDYKKHPEEYKGHVGHVSTVIRLAVAGRSQSPDIWEIQQILGEEKTRQRVEMLIGKVLKSGYGCLPSLSPRSYAPAESLRETSISTGHQKTQSAYRTVSLSGSGIVLPASRLYRAVEGSGRHLYPQVNRKPGIQSFLGSMIFSIHF